MKSLADLVRSFDGVRIEVMGDPIIDVYHHGRVDRLSPEAPVPVFIEERHEGRPGGANNVVANLKALGCAVFAYFPPAPHTVKHRFLVGTQQVFRIDEDENHTAAVGLDAIRPAPHAFVISDYGKGWCTHARCQALIERAGIIPVIVDPKGADWSKYKGATVICPNHLELEERRRYDFGRRDPHVDFKILEKRGAQGMRLGIANPSTGIVSLKDFPAHARQVFDVTGAGDTVVAVMAAALARTINLNEAAELANMAAGVVVGKVGTATCSRDELLEEIERG